MIHFSVPVNIMWGSVSVSTADTRDKVENLSLFIIEPGISLDFNLAKFFIPSINISYRFIMTSKALLNVSTENISGINIGMVFKFGKF